MKTWIALLRGINVGGHNRLAMKDLSLIFKNAGCEQVQTYIQSGNVVFNRTVEQEEQFGNTIAEAIETAHGFRPAVHLVSAEDLRTAMASNPYPMAASEPKSLHLMFLERLPQEEHMEAACQLASSSESITFTGTWVYVHAPDGVAHSKLARGLERALHMSTTARNWRTVTRIADLASSCSPAK